MYKMWGLQICEIAAEINPYASFVGRRRSSTEILVDGMYSNALSSLQDESTSLIRSPVTSVRRGSDSPEPSTCSSRVIGSP